MGVGIGGSVGHSADKTPQWLKDYYASKQGKKFAKDFNKSAGKYGMVDPGSQKAQSAAYNSGNYSGTMNMVHRWNSKVSEKSKAASSASGYSGGGYGGGYGGGGGGGSGGGGTTKSIDYSTRDDAKAIGIDAAKAALGRRMTKAEINRFYKALHKYEGNRPTITTVEGDTAVSKGGVSADARGQFTEDWLRKDARDEMGAYEVATTYMDTFIKALDSPVRL